ncbi:ATP-binding protein [Bacillus sp. OV322]|uniref:ATP-binding protein n=1 Tax=Bacillus sp. OV322 TaxID=1882764 RepID=UPI00114D4547|nr:ATP-binding protein [Bacillus sp. OV322]
MKFIEGDYLMHFHLAMKEVLLNFFLILTPIYFFQFISTQRARNGQILLGIIAGLAAVLCMTFPIAYGNGFLWDLRWVAFIIAIIYGGWPAGGIAGVILLSYRMSLGGLASILNVTVIEVILFIIFIVMRRWFHGLALKKKMQAGFIMAVLTFSLVLVAIMFHFWFMDNLGFFYEEGTNVFLLMGASYILSMLLFIYFSENIIRLTSLRETFHQTEKAHMVNEMFVLFSYELKKPLGNVKESLEKIQLNTADASSAGHHKLALNQLEEAQRVLSGYQSYSSNENGTKSGFFLLPAIEEIVEITSPYSHTKGVTVTYSLNQNIELTGDKIPFKQAILNILKNAIDATSKGGRVLIEAERSRNHVKLRVIDSGIGMTRDVLRDIARSNGLSGSKFAGNGLHVAFEQVHKIGGYLSFDSEVGKGTVVTMKLPLA